MLDEIRGHERRIKDTPINDRSSIDWVALTACKFYRFDQSTDRDLLEEVLEMITTMCVKVTKNDFLLAYNHISNHWDGNSRYLACPNFFTLVIDSYRELQSRVGID